MGGDLSGMDAHLVFTRCRIGPTVMRACTWPHPSRTGTDGLGAHLKVR